MCDINVARSVCAAYFQCDLSILYSSFVSRVDSLTSYSCVCVCVFFPSSPLFGPLFSFPYGFYVYYLFVLLCSVVRSMCVCTECTEWVRKSEWANEKQQKRREPYTCVCVCVWMLFGRLPKHRINERKPAKRKRFSRVISDILMMSKPHKTWTNKFTFSSSFLLCCFLVFFLSSSSFPFSFPFSFCMRYAAPNRITFFSPLPQTIYGCMCGFPFMSFRLSLVPLCILVVLSLFKCRDQSWLLIIVWTIENNEWKALNNSGHVKKSVCQKQNENITAIHSGRGKKAKTKYKVLFFVPLLVLSLLFFCAHVLSLFYRSPPLSPSPFISHSAVSFTSHVVHFY